MSGARQVAQGLDQLAEALHDLDTDAAAQVLAAGIATASPFASGRLRASWSAAGSTITSTAPHAAPVAARTPYLARGIDTALETATDAAYAPLHTALDALKGTY